MPNSFDYYAPLQQGIPLIVGPDVSSGRVPLDPTAAEYTPEIDNIDRGAVHTWNVAFERRLFYDIAVDVAYVGAKGVGGYAALDINAPLTLGGGDASRPYAGAPFRRIIALNSWGQRLDTRYDSLQVALNKPFTHGLLFKGAYTLSKAMNESDNDGRATLSYNTPSELDRNWAPAGFDRRHNFTLGFAYQLPWQSAGDDNIAKLIINDWQLNGVFAAFSGTPFSMTASGTNVGGLNTPSNMQTADMTGSFNETGKIGSSGAWFDTTTLRSRPGFASATRRETSSMAPVATRSTSRSSAPSRWAVSGDSRPGWKQATCSITQSSGTRRGT